MAHTIVIATNTAWNIVNFRAGLVHALRQAGYQVLAVAPPDEYAPKLASLGARFVPISIDNMGTNPLTDFRLFLRYLRLFARERPAMLLSFTIKPNVYGGLAASCLGIPAVSNVAGLGTAFVNDSWLTRIVELLYRVAFARTRRVFFQNNEDLAMFRERRLVRMEVVERLPGSGVNVERFAAPGGCPERRPGPFRFLILARLLWDKGIGEFVQAARQLRAEGVLAEFQLLGFLSVANPSAIPASELAAWQNEGLITYLGSSQDVRPALADADCVVLPSRYREGVPRSLLEAASMGKPIITTDSVGCRDAVDDGITGLICRPRDSTDLARKMRAMMALSEEERCEMGRKGREKMVREFDERIVVDRYLHAIQTILSTWPPHH